MLHRRQILLGGVGLALMGAKAAEADTLRVELTAPFTVPPLPYAYDALEPVIDRRTMTLHHDQHHTAYVKTLNRAISQHPELANQTLEELLQKLDKIPADIQTTVRNHAGGHANHTLFWESMRAPQTDAPTGLLGSALAQNFGEFATFQQQFEQAGIGVFGSGWVWLVGAKNGELQVMTTPNQDSPISMGFTPLLGNDLWEHAYYLNYQNRRADYLHAWWQVVNWPGVAQRYALWLDA